MIVNLLYFLIFVANVTGFTILSFNALKKDDKNFDNSHLIYSKKENVKNVIYKYPFIVMVEEVIINIYIREFLEFIGVPLRLHLLRLIFSMSLLFTLVITNIEYKRLMILHYYILSYFVSDSSPLTSFCIHLINNVAVAIIRYYLHIFYNPKQPTLEEELRKLREKKISGDIISIMNSFMEKDNITRKLD